MDYAVRSTGHVLRRFRSAGLELAIVERTPETCDCVLLLLRMGESKVRLR